MSSKGILRAQNYAWTVLILFAAAACGVASAGARAEVPAGTSLTLRLAQTLNSERHGPGTAFGATVTDPVTREGELLIPSGSKVRGEVLEFSQDPPLLRVAFKQIEVRGEMHILEAEPASITPRKHSEMKDEAAKIGGGAAAGALLGGVIGGDAKGALIGAAAGAAAGTGVALATKESHAYLPAGSIFRLELERPLEVSLEELEAAVEDGQN